MIFSVLLVDDDPSILLTLKSVFASRGFEIFTAASAVEAATQLAARSFDLVVTDMRMETDTSGYDVVRCAKEAKFRPVIVVLSAFPIPASEWRASGADAAYMKGGGIFRILGDIDRMLHAHAS
jgi:CheY-like chemotaxis protein